MPWVARGVTGRRDEPAVLGALVVSLLLAIVFVVADLRLASAIDRSDAEALQGFADVVWFDPLLADLVAQATLNEFLASGGADLDALTRSTEWSLAAFERQPQAPRWSDAAAVRQLVLGEYDASRASIERSLALQPKRPETWELMLLLARNTDDVDLEEQDGCRGL